MKKSNQKIEEGTPYWKLDLGTLLIDILIKAKKPVKGFPIGQLEKRLGDFIAKLLKSEREGLCGNANPKGNIELFYKGGCKKELDKREAYRCVGCGGWFHKECILKHFELEKEHDYGRKEKKEKILKGIQDYLELLRKKIKTPEGKKYYKAQYVLADLEHYLILVSQSEILKEEIRNENT